MKFDFVEDRTYRRFRGNRGIAFDLGVDDVRLELTEPGTGKWVHPFLYKGEAIAMAKAILDFYGIDGDRR